METSDFFNELDMAVTVCDEQGVIIYMNAKAQATFEKYGGEKLAGQNLLDCHPEPARSKLMEMMKDQRSNEYTIEKNGVRKIIIQKPWYSDGAYRGFIELSTVIPNEMSHFIRK